MAAAARLARGGRRRAAACTASSATPRAPGTPTAATRAGSTAARAWPSALEWAAEHEPELNATERAFLDASRRGERARAAPPARWCSAGVASLLVLAVIAGVVALDQRGNARAEATAAAAQRLGAQALAEDDLDRALLLARQGVALRRLARRRAATCSPRCSRARRRSACCAATATG